MSKKLKVLMLPLVVLAMIAAACTTDTSDTTVAATSGDTQTDGTDAAAQPEGGSTLDAVKARGTLRCGVSGSAAGFSETQPDGSVTGFDADYCRAVAAAVLGDATAVEFVETTAAERFTVLSSGEIDVLMRNTTFTQSRDTTLGLDFGPTTYFDGQGLMGTADDGFTPESTLADIGGAVLCTNAGTTTEKNITEGAAVFGVTIELRTVEQFPEAIEGLKAGDCDLVTTDASGLYGNRAQAEAAGDIAEGDWVIFPPAPISKEPLGPVYRQNDSQWADIVDWTVFATFIADEKGVTSANIDEVIADAEIDPELARVFGVSEEELQTGMGLEADAFYQVVKQVGNYDEIFTNNLEELKISREGSFNMQWNAGGLIYAPPAR